MYDFYTNPPNSKQDLREWLTSWLVPPVPYPETIEYNGEKFIQELAFKRAFYIHSVFKNLSTNEYVWWVYSEDTDVNNFPSTRFSTYEAMLEDVINNYYISWKLTG